MIILEVIAEVIKWSQERYLRIGASIIEMEVFTQFDPECRWIDRVVSMDRTRVSIDTKPLRRLSKLTSLRSITGIATKHKTLFINLLSTRKPIMKPLPPHAARLYSRHYTVAEKPADGSNHILKNTWRKNLYKPFRKPF